LYNLLADGATNKEFLKKLFLAEFEFFFNLSSSI